MIGSERHSQYLPQCAFSGNELWPRLRAAFSHRRKAVSDRILLELRVSVAVEWSHLRPFGQCLASDR
jgi:hypothetical protein